MNKWEKDISNKAKDLFDESVEKLDGATLSTLNRSRHRALEELASPRPQWLRWAPAAGVTAAVVLTVMIALPGPEPVTVMPTTVTDMEILLGEDSIEMLEDLEFYAFIELLESENDVG